MTAPMTAPRAALEAARDAILAEVPVGYGMTPAEATTYARAAIQAYLGARAARLRYVVSQMGSDPVTDVVADDFDEKAAIFESEAAELDPPVETAGEQEAECGCWRCLRDRGAQRRRMILCPTCGNKRCPKASDHRLACTGSNEPGQEGSVYR